MKKALINSIALTLLASSATVLAQKSGGMENMDHSQMNHNDMNKNVHSAVGKVNKVNKDGTVSISHQAIADLKWPAMTMNFRPENKEVEEKLKNGKTVNFSFKEVNNNYVITDVK